jgi:glucosamine-6-phosphate deaminase
VRVVVEPHEAAAIANVAQRVARALRRPGPCVLGLATGATMRPLYRELVRLHRERGLSFARAETFNLDEYVGLGPDDPASFHFAMREHLFSKVDLDRGRAHLPDGRAAHPMREAAAYEGRIQAAGGIDLQLLGIGRNGHLGFNEPGSSLASRTRVTALTVDTIEANRADLGPLPEPPLLAITMGLGTILAARACVLLALGEAKAAAVAQAIEGPVSAQAPASVLQLHPDATIVLDPPAASRLERCDQYFEAESLQRALEARFGED